MLLTANASAVGRRLRTAAENHLAQIQSKYNISADEYDALEAAQLGVCAICHLPQVAGRRLSVDHDHETGRVRGLLCSTCNSGLGMFKDDPRLLKLAFHYLTGRPAVWDG